MTAHLVRHCLVSLALILTSFSSYALVANTTNPVSIYNGVPANTDDNASSSVQSGANSTVSSVNVSASVQSNMDNQKILNGTNIQATITGVTITLKGTVVSQAQADAALKAAKSAKGVDTVKSEIIVK